MKLISKLLCCPAVFLCGDVFATHVANLGYDISIAHDIKLGQKDAGICPIGKTLEKSDPQHSIDVIKGIFSTKFCSKNFEKFLNDLDESVSHIGIDKMTPANFNYVGMCHLLQVMHLCKLSDQDFSFDDKRIRQGPLLAISDEQYDSTKRDLVTYCRNFKLEEYLDALAKREISTDQVAMQRISDDLKKDNIKSLVQNIGQVMTYAVRTENSDFVTKVLQLNISGKSVIDSIILKMQANDKSISTNTPFYNLLLSNIFADLDYINCLFDVNLNKNFQSYGENQGCSGLRNFGVTCYFNSTMQALNACKSFRYAISENKNPMSFYLNSIFGYIDKKIPNIPVSAFASIITEADMWNQVLRQNDAHELLIRILCAASDRNERLTNIFGTVTDFIHFVDPNREDNTQSNVMPIIPLQILPGIKTLEGLISKYESPSELNDGKSDDVIIGYKKNVITPGKLLVFQLVRFGSTVVVENKQKKIKLWKNTSLIEYPERLELADKNYNLRAVIHQYGGLGGGHYVANMKYKEKWYTANDSSVKETKFSVLPSAYVLFYETE